MKNDYFRVLLTINVLLALFMIAVGLGLEFLLDEHIAWLLAAIATLSISVFASTLTPVRLSYRYAFLGASGFSLVMMVFHIAPLIVGAKPHVYIPVVILVLMLPCFAINALLQRILLSDEDRHELGQGFGQRTRIE
jgi:hypothetical protein